MTYEFHQDFFKNIGYLASRDRRVKLDIETHPDKQITLEAQYRDLTGSSLIQDRRNYYVWSPTVNKWGSELRIYFYKNSNILDSLNSYVVKPRFQSYYYNARINNNDFVWKLIKYGFRASDNQDESLIRSKIPSNRLQEYLTGLNL